MNSGGGLSSTCLTSEALFCSSSPTFHYPLRHLLHLLARCSSCIWDCSHTAAEPFGYVTISSLCPSPTRLPCHCRYQSYPKGAQGTTLCSATGWKSDPQVFYLVIWWKNAFHDYPSNFIDALVKHFILNFWYRICWVKPAEVFQNISFHKTGVLPPLLKSTRWQNILSFENFYHIEIACFQSVLILGPSLILVYVWMPLKEKGRSFQRSHCYFPTQEAVPAGHQSCITLLTHSLGFFL